MKHAALLISLLLLLLALPAEAQKTSRSKTVRLTGQIVCAGCWDEADRTKIVYGTAADLECAEECAEKDIPQALAVKSFDGTFKLYLLEKGKFGNKAKNWLAFIARTVAIKGATREANGKTYLRVDALEVVWPKKKR